MLSSVSRVVCFFPPLHARGWDSLLRLVEPRAFPRVAYKFQRLIRLIRFSNIYTQEFTEIHRVLYTVFVSYESFFLRRFPRSALNN